MNLVISSTIKFLLLILSVLAILLTTSGSMLLIRILDDLVVRATFSQISLGRMNICQVENSVLVCPKTILQSIKLTGGAVNVLPSGEISLSSSKSVSFRNCPPSDEGKYYVWVAYDNKSVQTSLIVQCRSFTSGQAQYISDIPIP